MKNTGLKLTIVSSCLTAGIISHYGFGPEAWEWVRPDVPWWGNVTIYTNVVLLVIGLFTDD